MTYSPYLIANYATGLDTRLQPWLIPDDAQEQLFDGYVYRGTMSKREGYNYFATGERGGVPYRESRIVHTVSDTNPTGVIDGVNKNFTFTTNPQIARGSVVVLGNNPVQNLTDDGIGNLIGDGTGTVDYVTGFIDITFNLAPDLASAVGITYSFMPGNPVMMTANFITATNLKELIVADTQYVNRYNSTTNILEDTSQSTAYTGTKFDFFTWVNYADASDNPRLLFCNNKDVIQKYDGVSVTDYAYTLTGVTSLVCSYMVQIKDRLILLRTTEDGTIFPKRIRISGTGANSDVFDSTATGAGFIDIPDATWINGATFNRDDLIIFTEQSSWTLKYTGNDTTPFVLDKIDESRGSDATFSAFTYLNRSSAASKRGLIISDGYRVERQDNVIPDFTFDEIDNENFSLCFAGVVDADRDHYLLYPPQNQPAGSEISKRILVTNYDEDNYCIYRLPLSCMGTYLTSFNITWNDLNSYPNWASLANAYANWNSFAYTKGVPFSVGGGHRGEIWRLAVTEEEDNTVRVRNITVIDDATIQVTTDWNNYSQHLSSDEQSMGADYIFLTGLTGVDEINDHQFPITSVIDNNTFNLDITTLGIPGSNLTPYFSGGNASRVIPFESLFKQFNPFIEQDKKVRCGWIYMYVNTTGTKLRRNIQIDNITNSSPCVVTTEVAHNLESGNNVGFFGITGMTELNGQTYFITVIDSTSFSLNGVDSTSFGTYTGRGYATAAEKAKLVIEVLTNDRKTPDFTQLNNLSQEPYQGNCTNMIFEDGQKKWYKVFINQVGKFIQFKFSNRQAGANIQIQATMPGFQPIGRLI